MQDDIFAWNWKVTEHSIDFFWFEVFEGRFGYRMGQNTDFQEWDEESARARLHEFVKYSIRRERCGPYISEIPPLILKIRTMEQRHKRYLERKINRA